MNVAQPQGPRAINTLVGGCAPTFGQWLQRGSPSPLGPAQHPEVGPWASGELRSRHGRQVSHGHWESIWLSLALALLAVGPWGTLCSPGPQPSSPSCSSWSCGSHAQGLTCCPAWHRRAVTGKYRCHGGSKRSPKLEDAPRAGGETEREYWASVRGCHAAAGGAWGEGPPTEVGWPPAQWMNVEETWQSGGRALHGRRPALTVLISVPLLFEVIRVCGKPRVIKNVHTKTALLCPKALASSLCC